MTLQPWMISADLASGDSKSRERDWSDVEIHQVTNTADPHFDMAFGALWAEFGLIGEIEQAEVLARRMKWDPAAAVDGCALLYEMILITSSGQFAAVRDHTAIALVDQPGAVVHLSHNLVSPPWRRTGLAGWLRALPISTARRLLRSQGRENEEDIILVGEMEYPDPAKKATMVRLEAYEKAGYLKVDPARVSYLQPDFRAPQQIDLSGGAVPIPLNLILRRVGRETEQFISGAEVRRTVTSLYKMYAREFREKDMEPLWGSLANYPGPDEEIALVPPTAS